MCFNMFGSFVSPEAEQYKTKMDEFYNFVCQDTDLLIISTKVQNTLREVCDCLDLDKTMADEIEMADDDPSKKIYRAFMTWSEKQQEKATWGELMERLGKLKDPELAEGVKDYLVSSPPRKEGGKAVTAGVVI